MPTPTTPRRRFRGSQSSPNIYTLSVLLVGSWPLIWRRIVIDGRAGLDALHHVLQASLGWSDAHPHLFTVREHRYGTPEQEFDDIDMDIADERRFSLNQVLASGDTCTYLYDFGDHWSHLLTVDSIRLPASDVDDSGGAWVESGAGACPPEDAGGIEQYQRFLRALAESPLDQEARLIERWAGIDFDPARFDRQAANAAIDRMLFNGWIRIGV